MLAPGSTTLEVHHSLYNPGPDQIDGPLGTLSDTGGDTEAWTNARGFERADISALTTLEHSRSRSTTCSTRAPASRTASSRATTSRPCTRRR